jgi:hypothetical protein
MNVEEADVRTTLPFGALLTRVATDVGVLIEGDATTPPDRIFNISSAHLRQPVATTPPQVPPLVDQ